MLPSFQPGVDPGGWTVDGTPTIFPYSDDAPASRQASGARSRPSASVKMRAADRADEAARLLTAPIEDREGRRLAPIRTEFSRVVSEVHGMNPR